MKNRIKYRLNLATGMWEYEPTWGKYARKILRSSEFWIGAGVMGSIISTICLIVTLILINNG